MRQLVIIALIVYALPGVLSAQGLMTGPFEPIEEVGDFFGEWFVVKNEDIVRQTRWCKLQHLYHIEGGFRGGIMVGVSSAPRSIHFFATTNSYAYRVEPSGYLVDINRSQYPDLFLDTPVGPIGYLRPEDEINLRYDLMGGESLVYTTINSAGVRVALGKPFHDAVAHCASFLRGE